MIADSFAWMIINGKRNNLKAMKPLAVFVFLLVVTVADRDDADRVCSSPNLENWATCDCDILEPSRVDLRDGSKIEFALCPEPENPRVKKIVITAFTPKHGWWAPSSRSTFWEISTPFTWTRQGKTFYCPMLSAMDQSFDLNRGAFQRHRSGNVRSGLSQWWSAPSANETCGLDRASQRYYYAGCDDKAGRCYNTLMAVLITECNANEKAFTYRFEKGDEFESAPYTPNFLRCPEIAAPCDPTNRDCACSHFGDDVVCTQGYPWKLFFRQLEWWNPAANWTCELEESSWRPPLGKWRGSDCLAELQNSPCGRESWWSLKRFWYNDYYGGLKFSGKNGDGRFEVNCYKGEIEGLSFIRVFNSSTLIPRELWQLKTLRSFTWQSNGLTGEIPKELSQLDRLSYLDLRGNSLDKRPPEEISALCGAMSSAGCYGIRYDGLETAQFHAWQAIYDKCEWGKENVILNRLARDDPCRNSGDVCDCLNGEITRLNLFRQLSSSGASSSALLSKIVPDILQLKAVKKLQIGGNDLTGPIPKQLALLPKLEELYFGDNKFDYPPTREIATFCKRDGVRCMISSCTAFGESYTISATMHKCVQCTLPRVYLAVLVMMMAIVCGFCLWKINRLIEQYPHRIGDTVASISIVTSHAIMMSVIADWDLSWPGPVEEAKDALKGFSFDIAGATHIECLFADRQFANLISYCWCGIFLIFVCAVFFPAVAKSACRYCCCKNAWKTAHTDKAYNKVGMLLTFLAIPFTRVLLAFLRQVTRGDRVILSLVVFPPIVFVFLKLFREMKVMEGKWDGAVQGVICCRSVLDNSCCNRCVLLKPIKISQERLHQRMQYLARRYGDHAPYWQFVVWARQIALLVASDWIIDPWTLAVVATLICLMSYGIHVRVKPFKYHFQNEMDKLLMLGNVVLIFVAVLYSEVLKPAIENDAENVGAWVLTGIIFIALFGSLLYAIYHLRLLQTLSKSFLAMVSGESEEEGADANDVELPNRTSWTEQDTNGNYVALQ